MESSILTTIFSAIIGGSLGAFCLHIASKRHKRMELTFDMFRETESFIEKIEESYTILKYHLNDDGTVCVSDKSQKLEFYKNKFDTVVTIGDFLNRVAFLYLYWKIDCSLVRKNNLYNILNTFTRLLERKKFQIQVYDAKSVMESTDWSYKNWEEGWPYLKDYIQNHECDFLKNKKYRWKQLIELFL